MHGVFRSTQTFSLLFVKKFSISRFLAIILLLSVEIILSNILKLTRKHENNIKKSQIVLISGEKCVIIYVSIKLIYTSKNL